MAEASYPDDLLYHAEHDWARIDADDQQLATLGITGTTLTKDAPYAEVESVKAVSDVVAPLSGEIVAVNEALSEEPATINEDPYGEGWLVKVRMSDPTEREALMDAASYTATLGG
jgi:glycine cleavage system H protein